MIFNVTIKNISVKIDKAALPVGDTVVLSVTAADKRDAMQKASRRVFDGCFFRTQTPYGSDGTIIGEIGTGKTLYGRAWIHVTE